MNVIRRDDPRRPCGGAVFVLALPVCLALGGMPATQPASTPSAGVKAYAPGVRINWERLEVEVDARVVLREGPLELFACSPGTREHESVVAVQARPLHVFQAMGLIGLEPGRPVRLDAGTGQAHPASGQRLEVRVRHVEDGRSRDVPIRDWMLDTKRGRPPSNAGWVFCGSRTLDDGQFGADRDGTVVCVVDFDTALIGLPESHTSDNASLWVSANPKRVPPLGTACTLVIRAAQTATAPTSQPTSAPAKRPPRPL